ncbi:hypothetical protein EMIHUDRAFT_121537 [Emiliania huxleyi CCMP1516]|uniref:DNA polymerase epsilon catalytic subunit n=2 Tax=Emiliania huxleyi TaxID=2903 RepID=A0A0D3I0X2_EMIH1|nr:hypothetical protein EMIHUDRAFT_121537 [Emiliania huxleyi CCMP1516]EOD04907.1 hypothetical protein EMIHUDRAFT_121537 [Emiliania huxleyi CCMP1516]|eukprot:XP_005757336.1 hypothetical protein EMIHUDRAFT_121537 [Emiliania huxleyi CCMP1516]
MSAIEKVAEVRTTMSSAGAVEVRRPGEGEPTDEELSSFPLAAGAHLPMSSPALEFTKMVTHLVGLDPLLEDGVVRLRRNLLQLLAVQEFAPEARFVNPCRTFCALRQPARFVNPCRTFVLPDAVCSHCHDVRDLDLCRDATPSREWACSVCGSTHDPEVVEARLVQVVQQRAMAFLAQDRECRKCRTERCPTCAGRFTLRKPPDELRATFDTFASIAHHFDLPYLAETCAWLSASVFGKFSKAEVANCFQRR